MRFNQKELQQRIAKTHYHVNDKNSIPEQKPVQGPRKPEHRLQRPGKFQFTLNNRLPLASNSQLCITRSPIICGS